jgi:RND family efflux transporter MFP subunit
MSIIRKILGFAKNHKWKLIIAAVVLIPLGAIVSFALSPKQPTYVTEAAEKGDIRQTVEAVGTVISDRDLELQFLTSGIVAQVYVKEGDTVRAGQRLAALRAGNLSADIASAAARVQQAQADLALKKEGSRPEDIAVSEAEVQSKRAALETAKTDLKTAQDALVRSEAQLEALKNEALTSLAGYVLNVGSTVTKELTTAQNSLSGVKSVFSNNDVIDAAVKYDSAGYNDINASMNTTSSNISTLYSSASPQDYQQALAILDRSRVAINSSLSVVNRGFDYINRLPESAYFTESSRQGYKTDLIAERNALQTSLNSIDTEIKTLRDASANFSTRISAEQSAVASAKGAMDRAQSDISTFEASLRISEAQLQLKKAPTRPSDIASAEANVRQARASLARASADYANTVITAPIDGKVTKVNVKVGELSPLEPAITLLGNSPYRIEMYVSEIDVPKVMVSQTGSVELDAFRGTNFKLRVSEVDSASTDRDGVPKYRVRLDFVYPHDELKIGMTGDAEITTGIEKDVVSVPVRSVLEDDDGNMYVRIMKDDGSIEESDVTLGLEGEGGDVQVSGVEEGEVVIVLEKE